MNHETSAYGLINSLVFILFAFSFTRPQTARDWRSLGAFSAFILALFTEMYGFPLSIYLLSGWLGSKFPNLNLFSHDAGHLWQTVFGLQGNPHFGTLHFVSNIFIVLGFALLANAWRVLYEAQRTKTLATTGPYAMIRHPQYVGFVVIMFAFLIQWPTIPTLVMFPILIWIYASLARREEADVTNQFGEAYRQYAAMTPSFIPKLGTRSARGASGSPGTPGKPSCHRG